MSPTRSAIAGLVVVALVALGTGIALRRSSGGDAGPLVARAEEAVRSVARTGRMRTQTWQDGQPIACELDVAYAPGGMHRLEYRSAPLDGVLCIANPPHLWRYDPQRGLLEENPARADPPRDVTLLLSNYAARQTGRADVAGRPTDRVVLVRRHGRGVARRLWLDQETGLPLRTEEYDARGGLIGTTEYLSINIGSVPDESFRRPQVEGVRRVAGPDYGLRTTDHGPRTGSVVRGQGSVASSRGGDAALPSNVPPGYRLRGSGPLACFCGCGQDLVHTEYSDGLESVSLFECHHTAERMRDAATSSFARENVAARLHRGHTFVAVGRVSPKRLQRMLRSIP